VLEVLLGAKVKELMGVIERSVDGTVEFLYEAIAEADVVAMATFEIGQIVVYSAIVSVITELSGQSVIVGGQAVIVYTLVA
jgi:hypothetical protein